MAPRDSVVRVEVVDDQHDKDEERVDHGHKHHTHGSGGREWDVVKHGANYCTAHGWDCNCDQGAHDTHTRLMPHERRNGILTADSTIAVICSFFAVDALSELAGFSFQEPDWAAGECPRLCNPSKVIDMSTWTQDNYEWKQFEFNNNVGSGLQSGCVNAVAEWQQIYQSYTVFLALVGACGLVCAIQNATTVASGTYMLYDALSERTLEKDLADRFDAWWRTTQICRWLFSRLTFLMTAAAYLGALFYNPALECADEDAFTNNVIGIRTIVGLAGGCLLVVWLYSKAVEKCYMAMSGSGPIGQTTSHLYYMCCGRGSMKQDADGKLITDSQGNLIKQHGCVASCMCMDNAGQDDPCTNFMRCFMDCMCQCICQYDNCLCCGHGPSLCVKRSKDPITGEWTKWDEKGNEKEQDYNHNWENDYDL